MRKKLLCGMVLAMGLVMAFGQSKDADAKSKKAKVSYTIKKGTLTVQGKGAMSASMKFSKIKKAKNVKKIVVKKGITSVGIDAFRDMKKVETITVANSVKTIGRAAFKNCKSLQTLTIPGDFTVNGKDAEAIDKFSVEHKVIFNSKYNPEVAGWINSENLVVMKNDPKYISDDGVVYTKDKKRIVTVPASREELTIAERCKTLDMNAFWYVNKNGVGGCRSLTSITFPSSIENAIKGNKVKNHFYTDDIKNFIFKSKTIPGKVLSVVISEFQHFNLDKACTMFPDVMVNDNGMIYTKDGVLFVLPDDQKEIVVPDGIKVIATWFNSLRKVEKITLPEGLQQIDDYSFYCFSKLKSINIPNTVTTIGNRAFVGCKLSELVIPESVKYVGEIVTRADIRVMGSARGFNPKFACDASSVRYEKGIQEAKVWIRVKFFDKEIFAYWNEIDGASAYEVQMSFDKNFKKTIYNKTVNDANASLTKNIGKKRIYVRVRPYKKVNGKMIYGNWCVVSKKK